MNNTRKLLDDLSEWLLNYKSASAIAPEIERARQEVQWQLRVLDEVPLEAANVSSTQVDDDSAFAREMFTKLVPKMPRYDATSYLRVNSMTTTSTSSAVVYLSHVGNLNTPSAIDFADRKLREYRALQEEHSRPQRVRELINAVTPLTAGRFETAHHAVRQFSVGNGTKQGAAGEMRTLIDGVKGQLEERARRHPGERMNWELMCERLSLDVLSESQLKREADKRHQLVSDLSDALKDRSNTTTVDDLWARTLDHLLITLAGISVSR